MIECQHRKSLLVLNEGYEAVFCGLKSCPVNDIICRRCAQREGETLHNGVVNDFPRRNNNEMQAVQMVCATCPYFDDSGQECLKKAGGISTVSIWCQHPSNHCPEGKW